LVNIPAHLLLLTVGRLVKVVQCDAQFTLIRLRRMPTATSSNANTGTPTLQVSDARGLLVRTVQFHRREAADPVDTRVTHQRFDAAGRLVGSRDPYLFDLARVDETVPFNLNQIMTLSGVPLSTRSVDAGWRVVLNGEAGQLVESWDGRGSHSLTEYDELLHPVAVRECGREVAEHTLERFTYAGVGAEYAAHNLCGQLIRHDDPAGTVHVRDLSLFGSVLKQTRQFLISTDPPDWPVEVAGRDALHEPGDGATTSYVYSATADPLRQTDAFGNVQAFAYTVAGQLKNTRLTLAGDGQTEKVLVSAIHYNASGQIEAETAGNGVNTRHRYDEANGWLTQLSAHKADGTPLQILKYLYDAVGNVLSIEDAAQPIRYFNNQRIEPIKTYRYDTLYQLIHATGCEAQSGRGGPALPDFQSLPPDPGQIANYTQTYRYDAGGNLLNLEHVGAQAHSRTLTRARYSNRCLPERDNRPPTEAELAAGFDANGNLCELQAGQRLSWDLRNQLTKVCPVVREDKQDDCECYIYDGSGQRVRKVHSAQTNARTIIREVRYLPGLEIRPHSGTGEILHVITASAGSNSVQVLHWVPTPPDEIAQDQVRYSLNDHLKSSTLELDQNADLISQEWYYPFGGTALWAGRDETEAKYKTIRYSGKERDATGLYCYGLRYYAPWLHRWINPDPAGNIDGPNRYQMANNNPIVYLDPDGRQSTSFFDPDLQNRLYAKDELRKAFEYIDNNMEHEPVGKYGIVSTSKDEQEEDGYENVYQKNVWAFEANKRNPNNLNYYANHITAYQYSLIAKKEGFFGHLPSIIKRNTVKNPITLEKTKLLQSDTKEMLEIFLAETPNGRSTQRILNDFGLRATKIEMYYDEINDEADYVIHVIPVFQSNLILSDKTPVEFLQNPAINSRRLKNGLFSSFKDSSRQPQ